MTDRLRQLTSSRGRLRRPYVLVLDSHAARVAACLRCVEPLDVQVAPDRLHALEVLKRAGPPALLIADLSLPRAEAFVTIEALRAIDRESARVIAWAASRDIREYAGHRLAGMKVRVLNGEAPAAVMRNAIQHALQAIEGSACDLSSDAVAEDIDDTMRMLSDRARLLSGAPGVAVYLKSPLETRFRSAVTWNSDAPIPHSLAELPRAFSSVIETGDTLVVPDPAASLLADEVEPPAPEGLAGMVAVPIVAANWEMLGVLCVFDVAPLSLSRTVIRELEAIGRRVSAPKLVTPLPDGAGSPRGNPESETPADSSDIVDSPFSLEGTVLDRRLGDAAIAREILRARRELRDLSVILFVVDRMRSENGLQHQPAVDPLTTVGSALTTAIRGYDLAIRWGSEELLVVLPGLGPADAQHVAERVRAAVKAGGLSSFAVSGGVAEVLENDTFESVVARAFRKVEIARERGHNRVA
jgi:diguanylate cyclase (GGDEF)-like protein